MDEPLLQPEVDIRHAPTLADFEALADNLPEAAWIADADGWITWYNKQWYTYTGTTASEMAGWGWQSVHDPQVLPVVLERWQHSIASGAPFEMVFPLRGGDGVLRPFLTRARPIKDSQGIITRWIGSNTDITSQKEAERARQLLLRELNHRVKNLFAIAAGLVSMSARRSTSVKELADDLKSRLMSLARAHELIRVAVTDEDESSGSTTFAGLIATVIAPHIPHNPAQLHIHGPQVSIGQNSTTSLALVLHELATNSVKYGALSNSDGCLEINWHLDENTVLLRWTEKGGPPISKPPIHQGFGSQLVMRSVEGQLGGSINYDWRSSGVCITIISQLDRILL